MNAESPTGRLGSGQTVSRAEIQRLIGGTKAFINDIATVINLVYSGVQAPPAWALGGTETIFSPDKTPTQILEDFLKREDLIQSYLASNNSAQKHGADAYFIGSIASGIGALFKGGAKLPKNGISIDTVAINSWISSSAQQLGLHADDPLLAYNKVTNTPTQTWTDEVVQKSVGSGGSGSIKNITSVSQSLGSKSNVNISSVRELIELSTPKDGHAVIKHVNLSDNELINIIQSKLNKGSRPDVLALQAKFSNLGRLESALLEVFQSEQGHKFIGEVLKASREGEALKAFSATFDLNRNLGYGFKATENGVQRIENLSKIKIRLLPNGQGGFSLNSAFPVLN